MSAKSCYCINPNCQQPDHPNNNDPNIHYCQSCGSQLMLNGQYRLSRLLSDNSGFGIVYEAFKGFSGYILKVLQPRWNSDAKAIELFKREYDVLAELTQQGVTGIPKAESYFVYQTRDGLSLYCLVMEKVEGIDLEQWVKNNGKITQKQAVKWLKEIVLILAKIHSKNWFHRDIKPPNIMMRNNGELVLIDFGTAREETQSYYQNLHNQRVTGISSFGYTPTEQIHNKAVEQSDFFALGRTFVYLLTEKHPLDLYDGSIDEVIWHEETENIDSLFLDLVDYLMARLVKDRPQTTQEILQKLDQIKINLNDPLLKPTISVNPPNKFSFLPQLKPKTLVHTTSKVFSKNNQVRNRLITVGSIVLLSLGLSRLIPNPEIREPEQSPSPASSETSTSTPSTPTSSPTPENTPLDYSQLVLDQTLRGHSDWVFSVSFSPNGEFLASGSDDETIKIWDVNSGEELLTLTNHSRDVNSVVFSPNGEFLASGSDDDTIKIWRVGN